MMALKIIGYHSKEDVAELVAAGAEQAYREMAATLRAKLREEHAALQDATLAEEHALKGADNYLKHDCFEKVKTATGRLQATQKAYRQLAKMAGINE